MDVKASRRYLAYMLRLWQVEGEGGPVWLAMLEKVPGGERRSFPSLQAAMDYLKAETEGAAEFRAPGEEE